MGKVDVECFKFNELSKEGKEIVRQWWKNEMLDDFYASHWQLIEEVVIQYAKDNGIDFSEEHCIDWDYDGEIYLRNAKLKEEKLMEIINGVLDTEGRETFKFLLDNQVLLLDNEISGRTITLWIERENYNQSEISEVMVELFEKITTKATKDYVDNLIFQLESITQNEMEKYKTNDYIDTLLINRNYEFTKSGIKM